jgi:hypothetical protein
MLRSNGGVARVSVMWIIVVGVLFLAGVAFAFVASSDLSKAQDQVSAARTESQRFQEQADTASNSARSITRALGWYDEESADPRSDLELAQEEFANLRGVFTDLTEQDDRVDEILPKIRAAYASRQRELAELRTRIKDLENSAAAREETIQRITSEKDQKIAELERQLADETQTAQARNEELERSVAQLQQQFDDSDLNLRRAQNEAANRERKFDQDRLALDTRIGELSKQLRFQKAPYNGYPDGKILTVSEELPLAYIDIGAQDRVVRGLRFRVESGTPGDRRQKAWAEVTNVEAGMAEVSIYDVADSFDPVVAGDVILNPVFDPKGGRNAILVGNFSGQFSRKELAQLLERMGVHVQEQLDLTTTFMVVGSPLFTDPVTGEPLEEPLEPSDLPIYKDAEAQGVTVVPLAEIREYFKVEMRTAQR